MRLVITYIVLLFLLNQSFAQEDSLRKQKRDRILFHSATAGVYVGTFVFLNDQWYSGYEKEPFHFFDDSKEWLQVDKFGHAQSAYIITTSLLYPSYRALGYSEKKATYLAMGVSWTFQATIEVFDGFSAKWGASWSDLLANTLGIGMAGAQQLGWGEQRILFKYSTSHVDYSGQPALVKERVNNLYGPKGLERLFKDYNGTTFWLSGNIHSFIKGDTKFPAWLNIAAGYGAQGMLGGFENRWEDEERQYEYPLDRYRQYYLSVDVDWTRLPVKGKAWKFIAPVLNIFKLPAPALEFNKFGLKGHWLYF